MSDGIAWIGAHGTTGTSAALPGKLGRISLTCARGVDADEFLIALGADLDDLAGRTPCKDLVAPAGRPGDRAPHVNRAMYGTSGDWVYVLEDWGMATWATGYRRPSPRVHPGYAVSQNSASPVLMCFASSSVTSWALLLNRCCALHSSRSAPPLIAAH